MPSKKQSKSRANGALELDVVAPPSGTKKAGVRTKSSSSSAGVTKPSTGKRKHKRKDAVAAVVAEKTSEKKITAKRGRPSKKEKAVADAVVKANAAAADAADATASVAAANAKSRSSPAKRHDPGMPKTRKEMSKEELDSLNAHFMRQNRRRHTMEKSVNDFHTVTNGSMLLFTATSGGAFRGGRTYIHGSGRFGDDFVNATVSDVVKASRGSVRGIKSVTVGELFGYLIDGSRHTASIKESARASKSKGLHIRSSKPAKKAGGKATKTTTPKTKKASVAASASDSDTDMSDVFTSGRIVNEDAESSVSDV